MTWNAGADWNVDFGTLRVMALARDSREKWFDVHLVEIPADGVRPAVTIHRTTMAHPDFLAQFLWLVATRDPSVSLVEGTLFGTSGAYDGVILASGTTSTAAGRAFLLARDGLRIATDAEVTRAREGATPNFVVRLTPPLQIKEIYSWWSAPGEGRAKLASDRCTLAHAGETANATKISKMAAIPEAKPNPEGKLFIPKSRRDFSL